MICKKCGGYVRSLDKISRETQICGYCRGTTNQKPRQPKKSGSNE